jgi:hypothetical protein
VSKVPETEVEDLQSFVLRISRQKEISLQQMVDRAQAAGIQLEREVLEKIASGAYDNPTIETLRGIANGLEEPVSEVLAAAFQLERESLLTRRVTLRQVIWDKLHEDARRCQRTLEEQLSEILTGHYHLRSVAANRYTERDKSRGLGFLIRPESDTQKLINPIKVSEKLKELGYQITAQTVLMVLSKMSQDIDPETVTLTVSIAKQMYPDIVEISE